MLNWLNTLSASGAAASVAAAIYAASVALEKNMRQSALREIGNFINHASLTADTQVVVNLIHHIFEITFGKNHFSRKCVKRSIIASCIFFLGVSLYTGWTGISSFSASRILYEANHSLRPLVVVPAVVLALSLVPDYFSLWKSRWLLRQAQARPTILILILLVAADLLYSIVISVAAFGLFLVPLAYYEWDRLTHPGKSQPFDLIGATVIVEIDFLTIAVFSTLMTSLWAVLVMLACFATKLVRPLNFTLGIIRWAFDTSAHPVRVVGLVASIITWIVLMIIQVI